jgi:hypothetical protein
MIDADVNVEYSRTRIAEIRALSSDRNRDLATHGSASRVTGLRQRFGAALVSLGQRIGGAACTPPISTRPAAGRLT